MPLYTRPARSRRVPMLVLLGGLLAAHCLALGMLAPMARARVGQTPARVAPAMEAAAAPVVRTTVVSRSLRRVLRKGLVVRYSVDERLAGHFEVLLASSIARRIGLHGTPPTGLAAGSAPQIVIGRALLVTIAGGHSTVTLHFGRSSVTRLRHAAILRRLRKLPLTLRVLVRNAKTPVTATLLGRFTLSA